MGLKESGLRGSLRNVSVGINAIPDSEIFLPRSNDLDNFNFNNTSSEDWNLVSDGNIIEDLHDRTDPVLAVENEVMPTDVDGIHLSTDDVIAGAIPKPGDTFSIYVNEFEENARPTVNFGVQDGGNGYGVRFDPSSSSSAHVIIRYDDESRTALSESGDVGSVGDWHEIEVEWGEDGDITSKVFSVDQSDGSRESELNEESANDTTYTDGGFGLTKIDGQGRTCRWQFYELINE